MIGAELGNYRILEELGQGGMGVVYKAVDTSLDRNVAVKVLSPEFARNPELVERFRTEARAQANLNHTNIATLYAFVAQGGQAWMVMELIEGETISSMLQRRGLLPPNVAVPLFKQALLGIGWAHRMGIIHRDIKPANLMVNNQGIVKVMDFGIAKVVGSQRNLTRTGTQVGTVYYMSPEQVMNSPVDIRSDIYSLGVTLYEMLTANLPFQSDSEFRIMTDHVHAPPPPPSRHYPYIPKGVENAVLKALSKDPAARFQTVEEFGAALEHPDDFGLNEGLQGPIVIDTGGQNPPFGGPGGPPPPPMGYSTPAPGIGTGTNPQYGFPPPSTPAPGMPLMSTPPPGVVMPLGQTAIGGTPAWTTPPPGMGMPGPMMPPPEQPTSLLGTPQRKLVAGGLGLVLLIAIGVVAIPKKDVIGNQTNNGGGSSGTTDGGGGTKPHGEVSVWPPVGSDTDKHPSELKIVAFAADSQRVAAGHPVRLNWTVQGASTVTISPAVGDVDAQGAKSVTVDRKTEFVLTARKLGGETVTQTVVIDVEPSGTKPPPPPPPAQRLQVAFDGQPASIQAGQSAVLRWNVPGAEGVRISPGVGNVPASGSVPVKPVQTTTYRLTALGANGATAAGEVTIEVQPAAPPPPPPSGQITPEISFTATPTAVQSGGSAVLHWTLKNAVSATITPTPGALRQTVGSVTVTPAATTTYILQAKSQDGTVSTARAIVEVLAGGPGPGPGPVVSQGRNSQMIAVMHDHGGVATSPTWPSCYGMLQVVNGILRFTVAGSTDGRNDAFQVPVRQVQEIKTNRMKIRNQAAFHVTINGQHFNFVATAAPANQAAAELEAAIGGR